MADDMGSKINYILPESLPQGIKIKNTTPMLLTTEDSNVIRK